MTPSLIANAAALHGVAGTGGKVINGKKYIYDVPNDTLIRHDMLKHRRKFREWNKFVEYVKQLG